MFNKIKSVLNKKENENEPEIIKVFYPEINLDGCIKCMICLKVCPNQVFTVKNGLPEVTNPDACDSNCQICAVKCPPKVISYISKTKWK